MIHIPYDLIQGIAGTYVADHFNDIVVAVCVSVFLIRIITRSVRKSRREKDRLREAQQRQQSRYEYEDELRRRMENSRKKASLGQQSKVYASKNGKWSSTGWYYDPKTDKWYPPDYLSEESAKRWAWDPEKRIWIDKTKK